MGCIECNNAQISKEREYYVRVEDSSILVFGCPKHVKQMLEELKVGANIIKSRKHTNPDERSLEPKPFINFDIC